MFWDKVAGIYDLFANVYNGKVDRELKALVSERIEEGDEVLECACGTGLLSEVIAPRCRRLVATDFSEGMLKQTRKKCARFGNVEVMKADITALSFGDCSFDAVVAANVIHLLDEPLKALAELDRVCRPGGRLIIPTYVGEDESGKTNGFSSAVGKAGADFKREFSFSNYGSFFKEAGYNDVEILRIEGRVPCAVAVIKKA